MVWIAGATVATSSSVGQYEFTSIPQTFTHLQLRVFGRSMASVTATQTSGMVFNNLAVGGTYNGHYLLGNGSSASSGAAAFYNIMQIQPNLPGASTTANVFGIQIFDILDYTNTNKNKTIRAIGGFDANNSDGSVSLVSGLWLNTAAINSILINIAGSYWAAGTRFDLYGITTSSVTGA